MELEVWAKIATFGCVIGLPAIRLIKKRKLNRNEAIKFTLIGATITPGAFLILSFFDKQFVPIVTEQPTYMLMMGVIIILYGVGDLFDWDV